MASFDSVNYSLRPSKGIQREVVFEGVAALKSHLDLSDMVYIGFGSVWFSDFVPAHKVLQIQDMVSIEADEVGHCRAIFNRPYATVDVRHGYSYEILPQLFVDPKYCARPWVVWLDYDKGLEEDEVDDVRAVVERSPENTILLVTFDGRGEEYGQRRERLGRLAEIFGDVVPDELSREQCLGNHMQETLADLVLDFMKSVGVESGRDGGFVPAFRVIYKDSAEMVTVGGIIPRASEASTSRSVVLDGSWRCWPEGRIAAPLLTIREAKTLRSMLPSEAELSRERVKESGFDLLEEQIETFERYYREYPMFAQIVT